MSTLKSICLVRDCKTLVILVLRSVISDFNLQIYFADTRQGLRYLRLNLLEDEDS